MNASKIANSQMLSSVNDSHYTVLFPCMVNRYLTLILALSMTNVLLKSMTALLE